MTGDGCDICANQDRHCQRCGGNHPYTTVCDDTPHFHQWVARAKSWGWKASTRPNFPHGGTGAPIVIEVRGGVVVRVFRFGEYGSAKFVEDRNYALIDWDNIKAGGEGDSPLGYDIAKKVYPKDFPKDVDA